MDLFARLLIAHLLSDIPLNLFASQKRSGSPAYRRFILGIHTAIVFLVALVFFLDRLSGPVVLCLLLVAIFHFLIDTLRLVVEKQVCPEPEEPPSYSKGRDLARLFRFVRRPREAWSEPEFPGWFLLNLFDQALHLLVLALAAAWLAR